MSFLDKLVPGSISDYTGAVGDVWKDFTGQSGVQSANKQNIKMWNLQKDWQTEMANTAVQRRKADLIAAGINPMLAAGSTADVPNAPAPTVQPRPATAPAVTNVVSALAGAVSSFASAEAARAQATYVQGAQTANTQATTANTIQQTRNLEASLDNIKADTSNKAVQNEILKSESQLKAMDATQQANTLQLMIQKVRSELRLETAQNKNQIKAVKTWAGTVGAYMRELSGGDKVIADLAGQLVDLGAFVTGASKLNKLIKKVR